MGKAKPTESEQVLADWIYIWETKCLIGNSTKDYLFSQQIKQRANLAIISFSWIFKSQER